MQNKKVLIAMSGGVDSSVAAYLLKKQGYDIVGLTMKVWDYINKRWRNEKSIEDAQKIADDLNFPLHIVDLEDKFNKIIIQNFINEYTNGRTPNPCVLCNKTIKWGAFLELADKYNCDYLASGHYIKLRNENNRYIISKSNDTHKDQSYFLWAVSQQSLSRAIFPLANYTKPQVKEMAIKFGIKHIAQKKESSEICFVPNDDYRSFLKISIPDYNKKIIPGDFIDTSGKILGKHKGLVNYTIGQRRGLEIAVGYPLYVLKLDVEKNQVILGQKNELSTNKLRIKDYNLMKYDNLKTGQEFETKIRYKNQGFTSRITKIDKQNIEFEFYDKIYGVTPGQSAVFYEGNDLIGGGIIC